MRAYVIRRLLWAVPTFFIAISVIFFAMQVLPGDIAIVILGEETGVVDPAKLEALREQLGLNLPLYQQYSSWMWGVLRGDLGSSLWRGDPVSSLIVSSLPYTIGLVLFAVAVSIIIAIPVGVLSAIRKDTWIDYTLRSGVIAGISIPDFWFAMLILMLVVGVFGWYPPLEYATLWSHPWVALQQYFLPAITLGLRSAATSARMMRSTMLEVMGEDYVRTARAKGLTERTVIYVHALRNASLPVVTLFGTSMAYMFGGTVIVEKIFNIPGVGLLLLNAIERRDIILVQGTVVFVMAAVLIVNLVVDIFYAWLDPRIRYR